MTSKTSRKEKSLAPEVPLQHKYTFKVCKSVYHRTIQINHQLHATVFQFIILTFVYNSTCFGRFPANYQELNDCSGSLWFYLRIVVIAVLCSWPRGLTRRSAVARLLRSWVRIPPAAWMFVCSKCCVLSGKGLCNELITRPEETYRL